MNLSQNCKAVLVKAGQSDGTAAITTDLVDMSGYREVVFVGTIATNNAGNFVSLQQDAASSGVTAADLKGTKTASNKKQFKVGLIRPTKRYVRLKLTRGVSTVTGDIWALLFKSSTAPQVSATNNLDEALFVAPAEGTP